MTTFDQRQLYGVSLYVSYTEYLCAFSSNAGKNSVSGHFSRSVCDWRYFDIKTDKMVK